MSSGSRESDRCFANLFPEYNGETLLDEHGKVGRREIFLGVLLLFDSLNWNGTFFVFNMAADKQKQAMQGTRASATMNWYQPS